MGDELRCWTNGGCDRANEVYVMVAMEDTLVEYLVLRGAPSGDEIQIISRGVYRLVPADQDDAPRPAPDTGLIAQTVVESIATHDQRARECLECASQFSESHDGLDRLKDRVRRLATASARALLWETLKGKREVMRTLDLKRCLDQLLMQLELTGRSPLQAAPLECGTSPIHAL